MKKKSTIKKPLRIGAVDLFCGEGGLTHGLILGGVDVMAGIDLDPACKYPYETNNKSKFIEDDIRNVKAAKIKKLFSKVDVSLIAGCAPCQPFSSYSQSSRKKNENTEWELVADFGTIVKSVQPDLVTMENVPALLGHEVFDKFLKCLVGYKIRYSIIECDKVGIPQTRKRLVLLASKLGEIEFSSAWNTQITRTVKDTISALPHLAAGERDETDAIHSACRLSPTNLRRIQRSTPGGTWRDWPKSLRARCHTKASGSTYPGVYGRMEWNRPSPTITTQCFGYGNGRFGHPEQDRAISLREAAMLQTFPSEYVFVRPKDRIRTSELGRLIGNAVPVKLGQLIAENFCEHVATLPNGGRRRRATI